MTTPKKALTPKPKMVVAHLIEYNGQASLVECVPELSPDYFDPVLSIVGNKLVKSYQQFPHGRVSWKDYLDQLDPTTRAFIEELQTKRAT